MPRRCPVCATSTELLHCATDGSPTIAIFACSSGLIQPGATLDGRYVIGELLNDGATSKLYAARTRGGEQLAIKVLSIGDADPREATIRFVREAAITSRLRVPYTVGVVDYGQSQQGELFVALERLSGESLADRLARFAARGRPLHSSEMVKVAACVLKSLAEAHELGLVHRDVQPANIVFHRIDDDEVVKLIDFGLVRLAGSQLTTRGQLIGTPAYMSPEQARGSTLDGRSDLYSLGCVLYECVAGAPPFDPKRGRVQVMMAHLGEPPRPLAQVAPKLEPEMAGLIDIALNKKADQRFQTAHAMATAIESIRLKSGLKRRGVPTGGPVLPERTETPDVEFDLLQLEKMGRDPDPSVDGPEAANVSPLNAVAAAPDPSTPPVAIPVPSGATRFRKATRQLKPAPTPVAEQGVAAPTPTDAEDITGEVDARALRAAAKRLRRLRKAIADET